MVNIKFEPDRNRAAAYDGDNPIGECVFTHADTTWTITHTEVDSAYGGQGIAGRLVDAVVAQAREHGMELAATCSYARHRLARKSQ